MPWLWAIRFKRKRKNTTTYLIIDFISVSLWVLLEDKEILESYLQIYIYICTYIILLCHSILNSLFGMF